MNSTPPVIWTMGRSSIPGWSIGRSRYDRPAWRSEPGSVRAIRKIQSAYWASDVHTFWPLTTHRPSRSSPRVFTLARSEPASGSE